MSISHRATSSADLANAPTTLNVTKPTGNASGDILTLTITRGATGASSDSYTAPSGWTSIGSLTNQGPGNKISIQVWWALQSVANLGFSRSGQTGGTTGWLMQAWIGVDNTTPIDATGTANGANGAASLTTNAVTIATAGALHLIGFADWSSGTFSASGFTNDENAASSESAAILYNPTGKSVGSTGTVSVSSSASASGQILAAVPFALRPVVTSTPVLTPRIIVPTQQEYAALIEE